MTTKRPFWIQLSYATRHHGIAYTSIGTPYASLPNAIKEAQRLNADRIYNTRDRVVVWSKEPPTGSGEIGE